VVIGFGLTLSHAPPEVVVATAVTLSPLGLLVMEQACGEGPVPPGLYAKLSNPQLLDMVGRGLTVKVTVWFTALAPGAEIAILPE